jgi:glucose/arabinose dehydrogenase
MKRIMFVALLIIGGCATSEQVDSPATVATVSTLAPTLERVVTIEQPVDLSSRPGDGALYLVSRMGMIYRLVDDKLDAEPVLDIADLTVAEGERGLLGLAFSTDGAFAYLNFTDTTGNTVIASVAVDASGAFSRSTLRALLTIAQPYANHNGGDLVVEPSGTLLIATGDGGSGGDPDRVALDDSSLLGKVLRVDPNTGATVLLARGLRNPWRIDLFDDRLWLADVGQSSWEEVSVLDRVSKVNAVVDFGWSAFEGNTRFNDDQYSPVHVVPVVTYPHGDDGCSISGGAVAVSGSLAGRFIFADYCSGRVWSIPTNANNPDKALLFDEVESPVAVVRAGETVYVLSLAGQVWRIVG